MALKYLPRTDFIPLTQINQDTGRVYELPSGQRLPSVTTILSATSDDKKIEGLNNWRDFIGHEKADLITKESANVGTLIHKHLECHVKGEPRPGGNNIIRKQATELSQVIIDQGLSKVSEVYGVEVPLFFPDLYAGSTDCIGLYKNKPAIVDFKNTRQPKKIEYINYIIFCITFKVLLLQKEV